MLSGRELLVEAVEALREILRVVEGALGVVRAVKVLAEAVKCLQRPC
jgi:hypothetical protein